MTDLQTKKGNAAPEGWAEAVFELDPKAIVRTSHTLRTSSVKRS